MASTALAVVAIVLTVSTRFQRGNAASEDAFPADGGWSTKAEDVVAADGPCNIETHDAASLSQEEFLKRYAFHEPIILKNLENSNFRQLCERQRLLRNWGDSPVSLTTANTFSYRKLPTTLKRYVEEYLKPQKLGQLGNETYYLFGDIDQTVWSALLDEYKLPPMELPQHTGAVTFGLAGAGTGVPFHFHGPGFAEVIYGRKRWFLYPPKSEPKFDPDATTLKWFVESYPNLQRDEKPLECVLKPGEAIYFPDRWWHATLNVETSVFVSTFLSPS